jgi:hypothetical protein
MLFSTPCRVEACVHIDRMCVMSHSESNTSAILLALPMCDFLEAVEEIISRRDEEHRLRIASVHHVLAAAPCAV